MKISASMRLDFYLTHSSVAIRGIFIWKNRRKQDEEHMEVMAYIGSCSVYASSMRRNSNRGQAESR